MRLRLYHHSDGARVAYRELGAGQALALLHSGFLSHMEWEPVVTELADRFRVVLPDLPLHGDSEQRPRHPYTIDWFAEVMAGFCAEVIGPRPLLAGHDAGAEIVLHALGRGLISPARLVVLPNRMHSPPARPALRAALQTAALAGAVPGLDVALSYLTAAVFRPERGVAFSARGNPAACDLFRHAFADVPGNSSLVRAWSRCARSWPRGARRELLDLYPTLRVPILLLWADQDRQHPLRCAEEALALLPDAQLRVLESTGFLMAYDDPVGLARELTAFCG